MRDEDKYPLSTRIPLVLAIALATWYGLCILVTWTVVPIVRWVFA